MTKQCKHFLIDDTRLFNNKVHAGLFCTNCGSHRERWACNRCVEIKEKNKLKK